LNSTDKIINLPFVPALTFDQYLQKIWIEDKERDWNIYQKMEKAGGGERIG
jgi:hypothetical protein